MRWWQQKNTYVSYNVFKHICFVMQLSCFSHCEQRMNRVKSSFIYSERDWEGFVAQAHPGFLCEAGLQYFLQLCPNLCLGEKKKIACLAAQSLLRLRVKSLQVAQCRQAAWNTDASPSKNEKQTAVTIQENSFSVCYEYHT